MSSLMLVDLKVPAEPSKMRVWLLFIIILMYIILAAIGFIVDLLSTSTGLNSPSGTENVRQC